MVDEQGAVKLIEFGIAGDSKARCLTCANFTSTLGTADYISREQVKDKHGDSRSNIFSLGVIFYETLTGALTHSRLAPMEVMNDRLLNHPKPSTVVDHTIFPQIQDVLYRALGREPVKRYAKAHDFARDLRHLDQVYVEDMPKIRLWQKRKSHIARTVLN